MKNKKLIIGCTLGVLVLGAAGIGGIKLYQKNAKPVSVIPVEMLNSDWGVEYEGSTGVVSNSLSQTIVPDGAQTVSKIYVKEGQKVKIGDKVLTYDMSTKKLDLELKGYDVQEIEYSIKRAEKDLSNLKKGIVTDGMNSFGSDTLGSRISLLGSIALRTVDNKDNTTTESTTETTTESTTESTTETTTESTTEATTESTTEATTEAPGSTTELPVPPSTEKPSKGEENNPIPDNTPAEPSYTAEEIRNMISSKERELAELRINLKEEKLEYDKLEKEVKDGTVTAAVEGIVKTVNDPEDAAEMGGPIVVIVSEDKLYVKGSIDEFKYNVMTKGMKINATSWDTGNMFQAEITEISSYPVSGNYYGSGNPNVSYYPFTAVIEGDTSNINAGESVTINFDQTTAAGTGSLYLPLAYVRTEGNKSYVYLKDENDRLKKQNVTTGQTLYNTVIEVKDGITMEDYLAFPYGNDVKEGAKTVISENDSEIVY